MITVVCRCCGMTLNYDDLEYDKPFDRYDCPFCEESIVSGEVYRGEWRIRLLGMKYKDVSTIP